MKQRVFFAIMACVLLLSGCTDKPAEKTPVSSVQTEVEKEQPGSVFAHVGTGDLYYKTESGKTVVTLQTQTENKEIAATEGTWRFSVVEGTQSYPYMLFDGYMETMYGYRGSVYAYVPQSDTFTPIFEEETSNAVLLPTDAEDFADLAWVLLKTKETPMLCPINLRDGSTELGQAVSLAETEYAIEGEHVLVSLKTDVEHPLQLMIENKVYEGTSVLATTAYVYDFETKALMKIVEE